MSANARRSAVLAARFCEAPTVLSDTTKRLAAADRDTAPSPRHRRRGKTCPGYGPGGHFRRTLSPRAPTTAGKPRKRAKTHYGRIAMASTLVVTPAAEITARLDRLPMTRHMWMLVLLISLGGWFDTYAIFLTGSIAPGMFADKIFTPTTVSLFGFTGLASFIAALFTGPVHRHDVLHPGRRPVRAQDGLHLFACLVLRRHPDHGVSVYTQAASTLWRMIAGVGIGVELVTVDTFISELVPKAGTWQDLRHPAVDRLHSCARWWHSSPGYLIPPPRSACPAGAGW